MLSDKGVEGVFIYIIVEKQLLIYVKLFEFYVDINYAIFGLIIYFYMYIFGISYCVLIES